jgi:hypothetical protein
MAVNERLSSSLVRYIREIDIIILGLGILLFVDRSPFSAKLFEKEQPVFIYVILFVSIYVFLTYDWIAYNTLIFKYPYKSDSLRGLIRLYIDLLQLFTKALLVYLATLEVTIWHLLLASILFLIWHSTILLWHRLADDEYPGMLPMRLEHWLAVLIYPAFAFSLWRFADNRFLNAWTVGLCAIVVGISLFRQRRLIALVNPEAAGSPMSVGAFDGQVKQLRSVLEANDAARGRIQELDDLVQKTIADLQKRLGP